MNRVINSENLFNETVTYFCGEYKNIALSSKIISIYDLDGDGIERIGNPSNPYAANMYMRPGVNYKLYNVFETEEEALAHGGEIIKISVDRDKFVIKDNRVIREAVETKVVNK